MVFTSPEIAPEMGEMIDSVGIDSFPRGFGPLLIGDRHILKGPSKHLAEGFDDLVHSKSLGHQRIHVLLRQADAGQEGCGNKGDVFAAGKRKGGLSITPRQQYRVFLRDGAADQRAHVLVVRRSLNMDSANLCPIENPIGETVL